MCVCVCVCVCACVRACVCVLTRCTKCIVILHMPILRMPSGIEVSSLRSSVRIFIHSFVSLFFRHVSGDL